jgi:hypothetical protein
MYAGVVISARIQHNRIFADGKPLVVDHALIGGEKQSDKQMVYIGLRQQRATLRVPNTWLGVLSCRSGRAMNFILLIKDSASPFCVCTWGTECSTSMPIARQ